MLHAKFSVYCSYWMDPVDKNCIYTDTLSEALLFVILSEVEIICHIGKITDYLSKCWHTCGAFKPREGSSDLGHFLLVTKCIGDTPHSQYIFGQDFLFGMPFYFYFRAHKFRSCVSCLPGNIAV